MLSGGRELQPTAAKEIGSFDRRDLPVREWRKWYLPLIDRIKSECGGYALRVTLGTIRHNPGLRECAEARGRNATVFDFATSQDGTDGRFRLPQTQRLEIYSWFRNRLGPDATIALCKETADLWQLVGLPRAIPQCNCAL